MNEPGLVKREFIETDDDYVIVRETWDVTAPGCPFVVMKFFPFSKNTDAKTVQRNIRIRR